LIDGDKVIINDEMLQRGGNFRPKGSEIKAGELALEKDSYLSPAAIGFLAGIGVTCVPGVCKAFNKHHCYRQRVANTRKYFGVRTGVRIKFVHA
jgi:hypothetical protein